MDEKFKIFTEKLERKYVELIEMKPVIAEQVPSNTPKGGIYLFSEDSLALYVGRTKRKISTRIRNHFSSSPDCPLAWRLAREKTGFYATYKIEGSRKELLQNPEFKMEYENAKKRIRNMEVRYVYEPDPLKQALLEIYASVVSDSKYNDFDTH